LSSKVIAEVVPELYREVITMDDSFAIYRPPIKTENKPGENQYVKCRKLLLTNKVKAKELIIRVNTAIYSNNFRIDLLADQLGNIQ